MSLIDYNQLRVGSVPSEGSKGESVCLPFPTSRATCVPWLVALPFVTQPLVSIIPSPTADRHLPAPLLRGIALGPPR